jgi:hypothetical protein
VVLDSSLGAAPGTSLARLHGYTESQAASRGRHCCSTWVVIQARHHVHVRALILAYREKLWVLREFEGSRYLRWPVASVGRLGVVWALPFAGGVASACIAPGGRRLCPCSAQRDDYARARRSRSRLVERRPWWRLIANRADAHAQQGSPNDYARALIPLADYDGLALALRRAGLNYRASTAIPPPDAPTLNTRLEIYRPGICVRPGQEAVPQATCDVCGRSGVRGRVNGQGFGGVPSFPSVAPAGVAQTTCATVSHPRKIDDLYPQRQ